MPKWLLIITAGFIVASGLTFQFQLDQLHRLCDKQKAVLELDQQVITAQSLVIDIL